MRTIWGSYMYIQNVLKRCIYLVWLILFICNLTAVIFPNIFLIGDNLVLNNLSNFADSNKFITLLFTIVFSTIILTPYTLTIYEQKWFNSKRQRDIFIIFLITNSILKVFTSWHIYLPFEMGMFVVYPFIDICYKLKTIGKLKCYNSILAYVNIVLIVQILTLPLRRVDLKLYGSGFTIVNFIFYLDSLVTVYLYYFYICYGGGDYGTLFSFIFKSKINSIRSISQNIKRWIRKNKSRGRNCTFESRNKKT